MRKIVILNEINKATKDALAAFDRGEATEEQKKLVGKHNAGKQASEALAREKDIYMNYDSAKEDGSTESVQKALHNVVKRSKGSDYNALASKKIKAGQDIKQGKPTYMGGLETSKLGAEAERIEKRAAESDAKIDSMKKSDLAKARKQYGGKRKAIYNLEVYGDKGNVSLTTRTPDGKKVKDDYIYTNDFIDDNDTIVDAQIKSGDIRSLQQFGKKNKK